MGLYKQTSFGKALVIIMSIFGSLMKPPVFSADTVPLG